MDKLRDYGISSEIIDNDIKIIWHIYTKVINPNIGVLGTKYPFHFICHH